MCEGQDGIQVHHVRKLADLNKPGRPERPPWVHLMSMRKRKPSWPASPAIRTPRGTGYSYHPEIITGERYAGKLARTVGEGAVGKGPEPRAPRRRPTSLEAAGTGNGASATAPVPDPT
ncbi:hypothetical protein [Streptomyces lunaelactis]|uniref:hypothetical protein n=1 Tax=Streptomyces lunaelactis TaxID=1535768 RepID=UPI0032B10E82